MLSKILRIIENVANVGTHSCEYTPISQQSLGLPAPSEGYPPIQILAMALPKKSPILTLSFSFGMTEAQHKKNSSLLMGTKLVLEVKIGTEFGLSCIQLCW